MAISKEAIIEVSMKILNRDGIENLTMRTIAKELNIKAASLYWHIKGKDELYGEISEYLCCCTEFPIYMSDPKEYLLEISKAYRTMLLSTKDSVAIFEGSTPTTPRRLEIIKSMAAVILSMGVKEQNIMTVSNMLNNYILSFAADEVRFKSSSPKALADLQNKLGSLGSQLIIDCDFDEQFLYGLQVLFTGVKTAES